MEKKEPEDYVLGALRKFCQEADMKIFSERGALTIVVGKRKYRALIVSEGLCKEGCEVFEVREVKL